MRDALAILDKCIGISQSITAEVVSETVGIASQEQIYEIIQAILQESPQDALAEIDNFDKHSKDMSRLTFELISNFRSIMLIKTLKNAQSLLVVSDEDYNKLKNLAKNVTLETVIFIMDTLQNSFEKMSRGCDAKTELEMCFVKLCETNLNYSNEALISRVDKLERAINSLKANLQTELKENSLNFEKNEILPEISTQKEVTNEKTDEILEKKPSSVNIDVTELQKNAQKMENWNEVLQILKDYSHTIATAFKGSTAYISGDFVLIDAKNEMAFELLRKSSQRDKMRVAIKNVTGKAYKLGPYTSTKNDVEITDPLDELVDTARKLGINVTEK